MSFAHDFVHNMQFQLYVVIVTRVKEKDALFSSTKVHIGDNWILNYQHHLNGHIWLGRIPFFRSLQQIDSSAQ